jgi:PAS domain S-box-containing protein
MTQKHPLRKRAEKKLKTNGAQTLEALSADEARRLIHDLQVHQVELDMQNEELRQALSERDASRARYVDLYDLAPVGYCTLSEKGLILEANLTAATLLGEVRSALIKQSFTRFILKEDQDLYYRHRKQLLETGEPQACELRMVKKDGTPFWARLEATAGQCPLASPGQDADEEPVYHVVVSDITDRKQVEAALRASLQEKQVLLKEVHHRVKNNLAAIVGLVDIQGQTLGDAPTRTVMAELSTKIRSMALVHEQLYQSEDFSRIDFQDYLEALISHLLSSHERPGDIHVSVTAAGVVMGLDAAVPCGLLITELVTNAFKYAFPAGSPRPGAGGCKIAVSAEWDGDAYTLAVADNGVGLPANMDWMNTKTMGLVLVRMLGQHQLQGRVDLDRSSGTTFRLRFTPRDGGMMRDTSGCSRGHA